MKMYERNPGRGRTALLIHPMLSSAEGIELCVTNFWGEGVHCFVPDLSGHGEDAAATYHSAAEEAKAIHDCGYVQLPELSPEMQKRCVFAYGEKDSDLKQCRKLLPKKYPGAALKVWPGYAHCGKMTAESQNYAAMLKQILES